MPTSRNTASTENRASLMAEVRVGGRHVRFDFGAGRDLSIPMSFSANDPNLYGIPHAARAALRAGSLVGDTRAGGSCNVDTLTITPHCHGTHTECVGHVTHERLFVRDLVPTGPIPCSLISIEPESLGATSDSSRPPFSESDIGITARLIDLALRDVSPEWLKAIIIRVLPNDAAKKAAQYAENNVPFFTSEAVEELVKRGVRHILVDLPSLDRLHDNGEMTAHRSWWQINPRSHETPSDSACLRTITELIFVPDEVKDGPGLVIIHIPPFLSDAAPSRPVFYRAEPGSDPNPSPDS